MNVTTAGIHGSARLLSTLVPNGFLDRETLTLCTNCDKIAPYVRTCKRATYRHDRSDNIKITRTASPFFHNNSNICEMPIAIPSKLIKKKEKWEKCHPPINSRKRALMYRCRSLFQINNVALPPAVWLLICLLISFDCFFRFCTPRKCSTSMKNKDRLN